MTRTTVAPVNHDLDLVLERVVDVPRELVFRAWTEPELMKPWFCPKPWRTTVAEVDLRPGGIFRIVMEGPNGEKSEDASGCYLEVVPNERIVWTGVLGPGYRPNNVPRDVPAFTCVLTLTPEGKGTRYRAHVMHREPSEKLAHEKMGFEGGWGTALDQLVEFIKSRKW